MAAGASSWVCVIVAESSPSRAWGDVTRDCTRRRRRATVGACPSSQTQACSFSFAHPSRAAMTQVERLEEEEHRQDTEEEVAGVVAEHREEPVALEQEHLPRGCARSRGRGWRPRPGRDDVEPGEVGPKAEVGVLVVHEVLLVHPAQPLPDLASTGEEAPAIEVTVRGSPGAATGSP